MGAVVVAGCAGASPEVGSGRPSDRSAVRPTPASGAPGSTEAPADTAPATTAPRWTPEQQVIVDAYLRALDGEHRADYVSNPDVPGFMETHLDPLRQKIRNTLIQRKIAKQQAKFPESSVYRVDVEQVELVDGNTARITTCTVDDAVVYEVSTGRVVDDKVSTARLEGTLRLDGGVWKLAERTIVNKKDGVTTCDD
ncbi:MAG: hypothetical protein HYX32_11975 [Actinobacteria bacterium]|nr:hypothetical protein [Actinomycetota bacterium]